MSLRRVTRRAVSLRAGILVLVAAASVFASVSLAPAVLHLGIPSSRAWSREQRAPLLDPEPRDEASIGSIEHSLVAASGEATDGDGDADALDALTSLEVEEEAEAYNATEEALRQEALEQPDWDPVDQSDWDAGAEGELDLEEEPVEDAAPAVQSSDSAAPPVDKQYHVVVSVSEGRYTEWQVRVCYYWYQKMKVQHPGSAMGGFTRLLHSGVEDDFMEEIPTVVVDPLPPDLQEVANGYVVLNRPYAFQQWVRQYMHLIPERYVLMSEPDHLLVRPPPLWATPTKAAAFPFFYIEPQAPENAKIIKRFNKKNIPIDKFAPIGNSPVMISKEQLGPVVELWTNLSLTIKQDEEADREWGWVQEMYAWSIASTQIDGPPVEYSLHPEFMLQPPWDTELVLENGKRACIIHYTYGNDFDESGKLTAGKIGHWHWDKRDYMDKYPPMDFPMPPKGCTNNAVKHLVASVNEAAKHLKGWRQVAYHDLTEVSPYFGDEEGEDAEEEGESAEE